MFKIIWNPPPFVEKKLEAVSCFCEKEKRLLLLKRAAHTLQGNHWCAPGGKIETGETKEQAILREVQEETGLFLLPSQLSFQGTVYIVNSLDIGFVLHIFCTSLQETQAKIQLNHEHADFRWVSLEEALKLPLLDGGPELIQYCAAYFRSINKML